MLLSNKITYHFHSFPFLYFKTSNQCYLIPFHFILFHSFPLLKYIPFYSIPLWSFHSIPFSYELPNENTKRNNIDREKPTIKHVALSYFVQHTKLQKFLCVSLPFHEFQRLGHLLTNLYFFLVSTLSPSLPLSLSAFLSFSWKKRERVISYTLKIEEETIYQSPLTRRVLCIEYAVCYMQEIWVWGRLWRCWMQGWE